MRSGVQIKRLPVADHSKHTSITWMNQYPVPHSKNRLSNEQGIEGQHRAPNSSSLCRNPGWSRAHHQSLPPFPSPNQSHELSNHLELEWGGPVTEMEYLDHRAKKRIQLIYLKISNFIAHVSQLQEFLILLQSNQ